MTRKRFVKLLMSRGYSRNEANQAALTAISDGHTYEGVYFAVRVNDGDPEAVEAVREACERIAQAAALVSRAIMEAVKKAVDGHPSLSEMKKRITAELQAALE